MKSRSLAIVLFALFVQTLLCRAQSIHKDTAAVIALNTQAFQVRVSDLELSRNLAAKAITIAKRLGYKRGLSFSYNSIGNYYRAKGRYDSSLYYFKESLKIRTQLRDTLNMARSFRNVMTMEDKLGQRDIAIKAGLTALRLLAFKKADPDVLKEKAWMQTNLGFLYFHAGRIDTALEMVYAGEKLFTELGDEGGRAAAVMNLGTIYEHQKQFDKAIAEYKTSLPILIRLNNQEDLARVYNDLGNVFYLTDKYPQALFHYLQAQRIRQQNGFVSDAQGSLLNLGIIYESMGKGDSAAFYYEKALKESVTLGDADLQYECHRALGTFLYGQKKYPQGLAHLLRALQLGGNVPVSAENNLLFKEISRVYSAMGKSDSAFFYANQYNRLNDSLNEMLRKSIVYESNLKETRQELNHHDEKDKLQRLIIIAMAVSLALILIIFFLYYRFVRSKRNMLELRELVKDKELKALDAMLEGQNEERKRLAVELHDTIGSMLSATKFSFKAMEKSLEKMVEENRGQYGKINAMLDETMESVRRISHNMAAGIFSEKGIEGALAELCQTFEHPGRMRIHLNIYGFDRRMDYNTEVNLYRMVQELLTNIIKHAQATEVTIQLIKSNENINLTVEDDGRGFNPEEVKRRKGIGLSNIDLRVKKLAGSWNIDSGKGKGTTIIIDIPVKHEA